LGQRAWGAGLKKQDLSKSESGIRKIKRQKPNIKHQTRNPQLVALNREPYATVCLPQASDLKPNAFDFYPMPHALSPDT
jgi:hypothetical protein